MTLARSTGLRDDPPGASPAPDATPADDAGRVTPMMEQYVEIKAAHPDCLLFYRMGDFYELFFADAEVASCALGIVLTKRGRHLGRDIPMCGVPVERSEEYLHRLIALGHRVAVCEQLEDPAEAKKRGGKSVVRRDVVRLVTAGTLTEDTLLDARRNNYLLAVARARPSSSDAAAVFALAFLDMSTGEFRVTECDRASLGAEIARLEPGEVIVSDALYGDGELAPTWRSLAAVMPLARDVFDGATAERRLAGYFAVESTQAFGTFSRLELTAAAACVTYVERTQVGRKPPLSPPSREAAGASLLIDAATRANLELVRTLSGERRGSLLAAIDRTVTAAGSRLLMQRLSAPLTDPAAIARRHDAVAALVADAAVRVELRERLAAAPDLARSLARLAVGRGGPRDLAAIRDGLAAAAAVAARLAALTNAPAEIVAAAAALCAPDPAVAEELRAALADELPLVKRDGGFVRAGYDAGLDEARALRDESRRVVAALQARYAEATGIRALKIRHNNVLGYFVEVTAQHGEKLLSAPHNAVFIHRQTLAGQVRFTTTELAGLEAKIASAADRALAIELDIFERLTATVTGAGTAIKLAAEALATLDVAAGLAALALDRDYVRPEVIDTLEFVVEGGRHPVVEQALARDGGPFIANDCDLSPPSSLPPPLAHEGREGAGRIWIVTGPNMAGKSTFLRQNALIAVLAQMGSFVPARRARIGVVDRLFSRVGAADDLARGRSTFMVEMIETAAILNQAGPRSLVILDEIGRGTATFDGLSIAWATIEHLHASNRCRALFATHFHELTALAAKLPRLFNATMRVKEWQGDVVFLHEVVPGAADRSYGVQVAKLAGLPPAVIDRAKLVLAELEAEDRTSPARALLDDLPLFSAAGRPPAPPPRPDAALAAVRDALAALNPDDLSPREALEALYRLKLLAAKKDG
ncbi:MAG TPA: DNA mismatch repair protein MutS [Xanthobacteraceae bacterium]|nr:DNA mismatch repair protein MutS [Xanthobacteraceae bacterium]